MKIDLTPEMRHPWPAWAEFLRRRGLENMAVWFLEAAGPLAVLGAQALYFGGPLLRPALSDDHLTALAHLLEDDGEVHLFASFLREEGSA
ncbi:MAG: hypothetical protein JXB85_01960 [Anaerolineales bacterium]|nr:hypothetical protein [Anaerolineales bacterium]